MFLSCVKFFLIVFLFGVSCFSLALNILFIISQIYPNFIFNSDLLLLGVILNLVCNSIILLATMIYLLF